MNYETLQPTLVKEFRQWRRAALMFASCVMIACFFTVASNVAQSVAGRSQRVITLDPPTGWDLQEHAFDAQGNRLPEAPANFRRLGELKAGEIGHIHTLILRFAETASLTHIKSTKDLRVEPGGSCVESGRYEANTTCSLLVRFTPQGPGNRLGHLVISGTDSRAGTGSMSSSEVVLAAFGIGGYGYSPVVSFIPSVVTTVPGTYPSSKGLLSGAKNLTFDGGDSLYIADTGNGIIRYDDSSGTIKSLATGFSSPLGIAVDTFGEVYFDEPGANIMYEIYDYGPVVPASGTTVSNCTTSTPCTLDITQINLPGEMSMDPYNHLFFVEETEGAAMSTVQPEPPNLIFLYDPFPYQNNPSTAMAVDANDNLYTLWATSGNCEIQQQSLYNAENAYVSFTKVAGGRTCGFSGDGGLAGNAEIGNSIGQIVFDTAGDLYFSDSNNQRVRRIDASTGVIRTIAGNGTAGYTGDSGAATSAELSYPTGVGVNSQGDVYIISSTGTTSGGAQVIRKVGPQGFLAFGNQGKSVPSSARIVTVTNTGNSAMTLANVAITGTNPADFKIDSTTTNCVLTAGAVLSSGQTCNIGVIFTPAAVGARKATLTLLDNTISGADSVTLAGTGVLPSPTFKITAPANGATFTSGTPVTFSVSVTSTSGAQPTGKVQFKVDGANYGSAVTLSGTGTASTSVTGLTTTTHTLAATYSGDSNYAAAGPISVSITIKAAAKVTFTAPAAGATLAHGTKVTFAVTVTSSSGTTPTGSVKFALDGSSVGSATLVSGRAVLKGGALTAGAHTVVATYSGDKSHRASKATETITVSQ
jgi:hypothetical protein